MIFQLYVFKETFMKHFYYVLMKFIISLKSLSKIKILLKIGKKSLLFSKKESNLLWSCPIITSVASFWPNGHKERMRIMGVSLTESLDAFERSDQITEEQKETLLDLASNVDERFGNKDGKIDDVTNANLATELAILYAGFKNQYGDEALNKVSSLLRPLFMDDAGSKTSVLIKAASETAPGSSPVNRTAEGYLKPSVSSTGSVRYK